MDLEKKDPVYSVLEKKWYVNVDKFIKKLRKRLHKERNKKEV